MRWLRVLSVRLGRSFRAVISSCCADFLTADCGHAGLGSGADSAGIGAGLEQAATKPETIDTGRGIGCKIISPDAADGIYPHIPGQHCSYGPDAVRPQQACRKEFQIPRPGIDGGKRMLSAVMG